MSRNRPKCQETISKIISYQDEPAAQLYEAGIVFKVILPAMKQSSEVTQPSEQALDLPAPHVATQSTPVLSLGSSSIAPMRSDQFNACWQVELLFKWIKQHLRIKKFLGTSENAVKTQIWCAVSTYVLIAIVKKELQLSASLYTLLQILSVSVFEKAELSWALQPDQPVPESPIRADQLNLFSF